jgi:hypothetical protein
MQFAGAKDKWEITGDGQQRQINNSQSRQQVAPRLLKVFFRRVAIRRKLFVDR